MLFPNLTLFTNRHPRLVSVFSTFILLSGFALYINFPFSQSTKETNIEKEETSFQPEIVMVSNEPVTELFGIVTAMDGTSVFVDQTSFFPSGTGVVAVEPKKIVVTETTQFTHRSFNRRTKEQIVAFMSATETPNLEKVIDQPPYTDSVATIDDIRVGSKLIVESGEEVRPLSVVTASAVRILPNDFFMLKTGSSTIGAPSNNDI